MVDLIIAMMALAVILVIGYLLAAFILPNGISGPAELLAVSFGMGTGLIYTQMFIVSWLGYALSFSGLLIILSADVVLLLVFGLKKAKLIAAKLRATEYPRLNLTETILLTVILANLLLIFIDALSLPMNSWDAIAIWSFKAKILYREPIRYSAYFSDPTKSYSHPDYPLLVPFIQSYIYRFLGSVDDRLARIIFPCFFLFLLLSVYSAVTNSASRKYGLFFTALLATAPCVVSDSSSGYVDVALAFYYFSMAAYLYLWMKKGSTEYIVLSALFSALAVCTKNEGMGLFLVGSAVIVLFNIVNLKKDNLKQLACYLATALAVMSPWLIFRRQITVIQEDYFSRLSLPIILHNAERIRVILTSFIREFINVNTWNVLWLIAALVILLSFRHVLRAPVVYLLLLLVMHLGMYILIYVITPWNIEVLIPSTLTRLLIHVAPVAMLLSSELVIAVYK